MSITNGVELHKDCTGCIFQCITFDLEGSGLIWHHEDWFFGEAFLHFIKGLLSSVIPNKGLIFLEEFVHGLGKFREFPNEASIKVSKSKERAYLFNILGDWPVASAWKSSPVQSLGFFWQDQDRDQSLYFEKPQKTALNR